MSQIWNHVSLKEEVAVPKVGDGVTIFWYTDRSAGTITRVSESGKTFWFKADKDTRIDKNGMSESQEYTFEPNPNAPEERVSMTKVGWRTKGGQDYGRKVAVGVRDRYYDFSF